MLDAASGFQKSNRSKSELSGLRLPETASVRYSIFVNYRYTHPNTQANQLLFRNFSAIKFEEQSLRHRELPAQAFVGTVRPVWLIPVQWGCAILTLNVAANNFRLKSVIFHTLFQTAERKTDTPFQTSKINYYRALIYYNG